jgi:predicted HD phosphohydrolase
VVVALLHDIGDLLAPENHGDLAAAVLKPYVSEANHWLVRHHPVFQGYYYYHHVGRDRFAFEKVRGHPHFERTHLFCDKWDQMSFDPNYTCPDGLEPMGDGLYEETVRLRRLKRKARQPACPQLSHHLPDGAAARARVLSSRVLTPYFGVSLYIWSSILSITLTFLAVGYYGGGWLARRADNARRHFAFFAAPAISALAVVAACLVYPWLFPWLADIDLVFGSIMAATVLLVPLVVLSTR